MSINKDIATWAKWVSEKIKVPWQIIYSQWAMEQPEAINDPASFHFNLAGLTKSGVPGDWRKYTNLEGFANDYTYSFLLPNYPKTYGANDIDTFVTGLKYGLPGSYYGRESIESYSGKVKAVYNSLFGSITSSIGMGDVKEAEKIPETYFDKWKKYSLLILQGKVKEAEEYRATWEVSPGVTEADVTKKATKKVVEGNEWWKEKLGSIFYVLAGIALIVVGLVLMGKESAVNIVAKGVENNE